MQVYGWEKHRTKRGFHQRFTGGLFTEALYAMSSTWGSGKPPSSNPAGTLGLRTHLRPENFRSLNSRTGKQQHARKSMENLNKPWHPWMSHYIKEHQANSKPYDKHMGNPWKSQAKKSGKNRSHLAGTLTQPKVEQHHTTGEPQGPGPGTPGSHDGRWTFEAGYIYILSYYI